MTSHYARADNVRPWLGLAVALFINPSWAATPPGEAEFRAAMVTEVEVVAQLEAVLAPRKADQPPLSPAAQQAMRTQLEQTLNTYLRQLDASAKLGFAPGQLAAAHALAVMADSIVEVRAVNRAQACEQVTKAAASGLLAAALAKGPTCLASRAFSDANAEAQARRDATRELASAVARPDPYAAYYPLRAMANGACTEPVKVDIKAVGLAEFLKRTHPPLQTLQQTQAEAYLALAQAEWPSDRAEAKRYAAQAAALGCASKAFAYLQATLQ